MLSTHLMVWGQLEICVWGKLEVSRSFRMRQKGTQLVYARYAYLEHKFRV